MDLKGKQTLKVDRLDWILKKSKSQSLTAWEEGFIRDMAQKRETFGLYVEISEKQEEVLERIASK